MIKIIVVEDDVKLNNLIKTILEKNSYIVDSAYNPNEAFLKMEKSSYNLIISDIMMPEMDGFEFAKIIRDINKEIPILFITAKDGFEDKRLSYEIGVDDYMVKPIDINELVLRVGALLRRAKINAEHKLTIGNSVLDSETLSIKTNEEEIILPLKEFKILFKLLSYPNKIFTRSQIMNDCWGMYSESIDRTIDVHITHLREKLENNKDFSIVTVRGLGYKAVTNNEKK
ncbi:MAG: response regulator transcription factor [Bacilli bacterium]|nr:response regulator transcription factor [Bacilli bacterium]